MIKSMTGFGKGEYKSKLGRFIVEIRTVNHKYFDLSSKIPNGLVLLEDKIKGYLNKRIKRGKVNFFLSYRISDTDYGALTFDKKAVAKYYKMLNEIKERFNINDEIKLDHLLSFKDVIVEEQEDIDINSIWSSVERAVEKAVEDCNKMREREGRALYKDITQRISKVKDYVEGISKLAPEVVAEYKRRLDGRIKEIIKDVNIDKDRLETDIAIFAKQCDISEEITRARSHIEGLNKVLNSDREAGKKMDFILQELNREVNTMGSKANSIKISRLVIDIKSELEKVREQVQNVE